MSLCIRYSGLIRHGSGGYVPCAKFISVFTYPITLDPHHCHTRNYTVLADNLRSTLQSRLTLGEEDGGMDTATQIFDQVRGRMDTLRQPRL